MQYILHAEAQLELLCKCYTDTYCKTVPSLQCFRCDKMSLGLSERLHVALTARHYGGTNTWEADVTQSHTDTVLHFIHLIPPSAQ